MSDRADYTYGEPAPIQNDGPGMHDLVIKDILKRDPYAGIHLIAEVTERRDFGFMKYNTMLQANNGRNALRDALDEMVDLIVYLRQHMEEQHKVGMQARAVRKMYDRLLEDAMTLVLLLQVQKGDSRDSVSAAQADS
jgi:hypothetical protein